MLPFGSRLSISGIVRNVSSAKRSTWTQSSSPRRVLSYLSNRNLLAQPRFFSSSSDVVSFMDVSADHPLLKDPRFPGPVDGIPATTRLLTLLAAHVAKGELDAVKEDWAFLPEHEHDNGFEIILQTFLFGGLPRVINALSAIRQMDKMKAPEKEHDGEPANYTKRGEDLNKAIYGKQYDKLRQRVAMLHPDLDHWMIEIAYGRVLARPGPTLRDRELCLVSVLAGMNCAPQLISHIRGSIHSGANFDQVRRVLDQTIWLWGLYAQKHVDGVWREFMSQEHKNL